MEEIKRCKKCGARLLEHETRCPVCGTPVFNQEEETNAGELPEWCASFFKKVDEETEQEVEPEKSYWRNKKIWAVFIVLVLVTSLMKNYISDNPVKVAQAENETTQTAEKLKATNKYSQATNINALLGFNYVSDDGVYLVIDGALMKYQNDLTQPESLLDSAVSAFSEDEDNYYYLDDANNYLKMDKQSKKTDVLLKKAYYVQHLGDHVYYQNDPDGETIHCLNIKTNEDHKINDEISYNLIIDEDKQMIFYTNKDNELVSIDLEGQNRKVLVDKMTFYTYDGKTLYYLNDKGLVKNDLEGNDEEIYQNSNLGIVNIVNEKIVVQDKTTIYTMNLDGSEVKKLYTMDAGGSLSFEVMGDRLLVLTKGIQDARIGYELVGLDGKRFIIDSGEYPTIKGNEF